MSSSSNDPFVFIPNNNTIAPNTFTPPAVDTPAFIAIVSVAASLALCCFISLLICACRTTSKPQYQIHHSSSLLRSLSRGNKAAMPPPPIPARHLQSSLHEDPNAKGFKLPPNIEAKTFKVYFAHQKERGDELNLVPGDRVVIHHVYQDGWCRGVSKRAGGPAFFPGNILGPESASIIFAQFTQNHRRV